MTDTLYPQPSRALPGMLITLLCTACLLCAPPSYAWSSLDAILFEDVHSMAIERVLAKTINNKDFIDTLKKQQHEVDKKANQTWDNSFKHAMTGTDGNGQTRAGNMPDFIKKAEKFIKDNLTNAQKSRHNGADTPDAMVYLGQAIHTMEDGTSPSHEPFQEWSANEKWYQAARHLANERFYPEDTGPEPNARRLKLEGAVLWAYEIYIGKADMPQDGFFDATGYLKLPPRYLAHR